MDARNKNISSQATDTPQARKLLSDKAAVYFCAALLGLVAGFGAWVLKTMIKYVSRWLTAGMDASGPNWRLLILPVAGIVLTVVFTRLILRRPIEHGTARLKKALAAGEPDLPFSLTYSPLLANTLTLGFGGSAGSEGPIAYASAAIASNLGRRFGIRGESLALIVACGAGAGIAGIFTAPIGGVLFTVEVLGVPLTTVAVMALVIACLVAGLTAFVLAGCAFDAPFTAVNQFELPILPHILLLGLFCGLYAIYYNYTGKLTARYLGAIGNVWVRAVVSGLVVAAMLFFFPTLYGEGYDAVVKVINDHPAGLADYSVLGLGNLDGTWVMILFAGALLLCKGIAATDSNSGGGVAGEYAPALFAGCMAGWFFAMLMNHAIGSHLPEGNFAVIGMAAVMAGAVKAPLMSMFITVEMTDGYDFLLPVALAATVSYFVARIPDYIAGRRKGSATAAQGGEHAARP